MGETVLPSSDDDLLNLPDQYRTLDSGELFLVSAEQLPRGVALIYMSDFGRRILKGSAEWTMDGTFETVPHQFAQLYVVFGSGGACSERVFPGAYMLLPDKTADTYKHAFTILKNNIQHSPTTIYIDFEAAVIKAAKEVFSEQLSVSCCRFHRKKNLFFHVGQKGCLQLFNENEHFQIGLDLIYSLDRIPPEDVIFAWEQVIQPYFAEHFEHDDCVQNFLGYVERTFIGKMIAGQRRPALFPPAIWSTHSNILQGNQTTTNAVESWNAKWNSTTTNHNILRIITNFKMEDSLARTKFQELVSGRFVDPNPGRTSRKQAKLEELKRAMLNYNRQNVKEFLYGLCGGGV